MRRLLNPELALLLAFLVIIVSVPVVQFAIEAGRGEQPLALDIFKQKPTARNLRAYEHGLEDANWLAAKLRPCVQYAQFAWLRDGGAKSLIGRDGWLFYRPGVEYVTERPRTRQGRGTVNEAVAAILDLKAQLAARGIQLLVMPAPKKESHYPEKLTWRATGRTPAMSLET
ncbi:MAG: alginate O-acetyltransferase AlgX-related protein, partial [Limisphaerales bacterium]